MQVLLLTGGVVSVNYVLAYVCDACHLEPTPGVQVLLVCTVYYSHTHAVSLSTQTRIAGIRHTFVTRAT
jgi:uncharacterized membrane protein